MSHDVPGGAPDLDLALPAHEVAPALLGLVLRCGERAGRIVEVEAYGAADDPASHAFRGPTPRTASMFGPPGLLYVYLSYGIHRCANIVCGPAGEGAAVLVRALEPIEGLEAMAIDRPRATKPIEYCNGPGKLTAALGIGLHHDGQNVLASGAEVRLELPSKNRPFEIVSGPRVGITKAVERPWRFAIADDAHVSRPRRDLHRRVR